MATAHKEKSKENKKNEYIDAKYSVIDLFAEYGVLLLDGKISTKV